jgi:hypothetical protein
MNYNSIPGNTGAFNTPRSGSAGYVNFSQGLPFYQGRSQVATIPEYQRMPGQLAKDVLMKIEEKGSNLMKILYEYAEKNGKISKPDVKYWWQTEVLPHPRFYLKQAAYTGTGSRSTFKLTDYTRPTQSYPTSTGNPKVKGNITRLQAGDFILLMFSWLAPGRTGAVAYKESYSTPIPEIAKIISVDYAANSFVCERNWAGVQRTSAGNAPGTVTVVANSTSSPSSSQVREKDAFFLRLPRAMKEDDIDSKIYGMTGTWNYGIMQRSLRAWGSGFMGETIRKNLGLGSKYSQDRNQAIKDYWNDIALSALWGEKSEGFDDETGAWWGTTDGLLTNLSAGHHIGIVPMRIGLLRSAPQYAYGTFDIAVLNKFLEDKGYYSETGRLVAACGAEAYTAFATMINQMTQNIPDIVSEWKVVGKSFRSSGGLIVDFVEEHAMTLNGMRNKMLLMDPAKFRLVDLDNYPTDIVEVQNENPLLQNGFIHGVHSFIDLNPDSHWLCTLDANLASTTGATFAELVLGVPVS